MLYLRRSSPLRYSIAVLTVSLALLVTSQIDLLANRTPFALFFAAVMVSSWYGGWKPGLVTVVLSALTGDYFIVPPRYSLIPDWDDAIQVSIFILVALLINWLTASRWQSEKSLRESEERYRVIAETAHDGILTIDEAGTLLFVNQAAEQIFGYTADEILGQNLTALMPDHLRQAHQTGLDRYLKTGQRKLGWGAIELPGLHKSGKQIPLEISFGEIIKDG